jgi:hypothetical protein
MHLIPKPAQTIDQVNVIIAAEQTENDNTDSSWMYDPLINLMTHDGLVGCYLLHAPSKVSRVDARITRIVNARSGTALIVLMK